MSIPQLHRTDSHTYDVLSTPAELRELFRLLGFKHIAGSPSSIFTDRWVHEGASGRTALIYFDDMRRLVLLGPPVPQVDALAESEIVV